MTNKTRSWDRLFTAVTFAEAGEIETAAEIAHGGRRVLLAVSEADVGPKVLNYARNLCARVDAEIEILLVSREERIPPRLYGFLGELGRSDAPFCLVRRPGPFRSAVIDYAQSRRNILFVIVDSREELEIARGAGGRASASWRRLGCPLVMASEAA